MRSGPEVLHSRQKNLDVPFLNFKKTIRRVPSPFGAFPQFLEEACMSLFAYDASRPSVSAGVGSDWAARSLDLQLRRL